MPKVLMRLVRAREPEKSLSQGIVGYCAPIAHTKSSIAPESVDGRGPRRAQAAKEEQDRLIG